MNKSKTVDDSDELYEKKHKRRKMIFLILGVLIILLVLAFSVGYNVWQYYSMLRNERINIAEGAVKIAAGILDTNKFNDYLDGKIEHDYEATEKALYNIKDNSVGLKYLSVLQIHENDCTVIFYIEEPIYEEIYERKDFEYNDDLKKFIPNLLAGEKIAPFESKNDYEWTVTINQPLSNEANENIYYVCADVEMSDIRDNAKKFLYQSVFITLNVLILAFLVCLLLLRMYRKISDTEKRLHKQEQASKILQKTVTAFVKTVDLKDHYTNGHSFRVAKYTAMLCEELGYDEETTEKYYYIALMHDIGKIGIPDDILNKTGKLTDEEFEMIQSHTSLGYDVLKDVSKDLADGALCHHERPDGKGYPMGLTGENIPRVAQIIAVADTFDAMYSNRPYRKRMNFEKAVSIIREVSGTQLTSDVVDAFMRLAEKGKFRADDDKGGGSTEDINNIQAGER